MSALLQSLYTVLPRTFVLFFCAVIVEVNVLYPLFWSVFFSPRFHCLKEAVFGSVTGAHLEQLCLTASLLEKSEGSFQLSELPEDQAGVCVCVRRFIISLSLHLRCSCVLLLFIFCIVCVHAFELLISRLSQAVLMSVQSPPVFTGSWRAIPRPRLHRRTNGMLKLSIGQVLLSLLSVLPSATLTHRGLSLPDIFKTAAKSGIMSSSLFWVAF